MLGVYKLWGELVAMKVMQICKDAAWFNTANSLRKGCGRLWRCNPMKLKPEARSALFQRSRQGREVRLHWLYDWSIRSHIHSLHTFPCVWILEQMQDLQNISICSVCMCLSCFEACSLAGHFLVAHLVLKGALENLITFAAKWLHHFAIVSRLDFGTCRKVCWLPRR